MNQSATYPLGELVEFRRGLTYKKSDEVEFSNNAVLRANNIDRETGSLNLSDIRYIDPEIDIPQSKRVVKGSLLICTASGSKNHLGKVAIIEDQTPFAFGGFMGLLVPRTQVDSKYLFYFTRSSRYEDFIASLSDGANINNLKFGDLSKLEVPLPPMEEQKKIVALLDQVFAALDRARANADANLADAEKLLGATIAGLFASSAHGSILPLGKISDFAGGSQPPKSQFTEVPREGYIRLLQIRDFSSDDKAVYIPDDGNRRRCVDDDIMIARYGASVGQIHRGKSGCYNVALIRTSPDPEIVDRDYFYYYLKSDLFQKPLLARSSRGAQDGFNKGDIADLPVPVPPLAKQAEMVATIAAVERQSKLLNAHYAETANSLDELRQAILQKAFAGELT